MKILPLVVLGQTRIPALVDGFADSLPISSMTVVAGGLITLTCSAPHKLPVGSQDTVSITNALTPNPITALVHTNAGSVNDIQVTTQYAHNLTLPTDAMFAQYQGFATLTGIGAGAAIEGAIQLVSVLDRNNFIVRPASAISIPGTIPGTAALLESLEIELVGWNVATATSPTVLTIPTPSAVTRNYTAVAPIVVRNIRIFGAYDLAHALGHFTRFDSDPVTGMWMFLIPKRNVRLSRDRVSATDAAAEMTPYSVLRQTVIDGFEVLVVIPANAMAAGVGAMDRAAGPVLRAVMRTFNGLKVPRSEFAGPGQFVAVLQSHGADGYTKANYVHHFVFESILQITNGDTVYGYEIPDLSAIDQSIMTQTPAPTTPLLPAGSVPWDNVSIDGIRHDDPDSQPLTTTAVPLDAAS